MSRRVASIRLGLGRFGLGLGLGRFGLGLAAALLAVAVPAGTASAHPLDVYVQGAYLTLAPAKVVVELDLSPGVLLAPQVLSVLDADHDRQISDGEARAYAAQALRQVELKVDDRPLALALSGVDVPPYLTVQAGYGTLRVHAEAGGPPSGQGEHVIFFRNGFAPKGSAYQVNTFVQPGAPVTLGAQRRSENQQQGTVTYRITPGVSAGTTPVPAAAPANRLLAFVEGPSLSGWAMLVALGLAALLGALHALTPGHAKTLMAAYLVGSGGTARNAITLGAVVTFTHTASVVVIGLIALLASQFLVPGLLVPGLEIGSGLLVVGLGARLLRQRWSARTRSAQPAETHHPKANHELLPPHEHAQPHEHGNGHGHGHGALATAVPTYPKSAPHAHGGRAHTHELPAGGITPGNLIAMGVSGGLVPCPEALGVMVLAVGVNRIAVGLGLIVAFSLGLAAVLIGLGLLLVRSRSLLARFGQVEGRWLRLLPIVSAAVVTGLGLALVTKGIAATVPL